MNKPPSLGTIGPEDFRRIREVFEAALEHSPADRETFVEHACGGNALLLAEVERMLAADSEGNSLLDNNERLHPGTTFAGYLRITGFLGRGGMGEVYRARDGKLNRDVALKILPETFAPNAERLARFKREAQLLASLNHPNIAAIYGFEESNGMQALVLELVEGPTLADRIAQGPIPIDETVAIARQIAEALEAAHEQGIIHRDLKPANVKLRPDAAVKVLDFGLAKGLPPTEAAPAGSGNSPTLTSPAMTAAGVLLGTAPYMAPEQAKGRAVDRPRWVTGSRNVARCLRRRVACFRVGWTEPGGSKHVRTASAKQPSLVKKRVSPHTLRRACAMHTLHATGDIRKVALWLGHASLQITEVYLRADPTEKLETMASLVPPNVRRGQFRPPDKLLAMLRSKQ